MRLPFFFFVLLAVFVVPFSSAETIDVSILSVLKPQRILLKLDYPAKAALLLHSDERTQTFVLTAGRAATLHASHGKLLMDEQGSEFDSASLSCPSGCRLELNVPGFLRRIYTGRFRFNTVHNTINIVLNMPVESFTASVLASEMAEYRSVEAMKAYAVVVRSFALSSRRHPERGSDVCDTTHCQVFQAYLPGRPHLQGVEATTGLILTYRGAVLQAFFSRSCGGKTASFEEVWPGESPRYPYHPVGCPACKPENSGWSATFTSKQLEKLKTFPQATREQLRILSGRTYGWNLIRSNDFEFEKAGDVFVFRGKGTGHRVGLCMAGASALAESGKPYRQILSHFFPNTEIRTLNN